MLERFQEKVRQVSVVAYSIILGPMVEDNLRRSLVMNKNIILLIKNRQGRG